MVAPVLMVLTLIPAIASTGIAAFFAMMRVPPPTTATLMVLALFKAEGMFAIVRKPIPANIAMPTTTLVSIRILVLIVVFALLRVTPVTLANAQMGLKVPTANKQTSNATVIANVMTGTFVMAKNPATMIPA
jgi:hypothetical protein